MHKRYRKSRAPKGRSQWAIERSNTRHVRRARDIVRHVFKAHSARTIPLSGLYRTAHEIALPI